MKKQRNGMNGLSSRVQIPEIINGHVPTSRKRWQYNIFAIEHTREDLQEKLNDLGKRGWRLVPMALPATYLPDTLILEREIMPRHKAQNSNGNGNGNFRFQPNKFTPNRKAKS
jgi:hypothetical protein